MKEALLDVGGLRLRVVEDGEGTSILALHGFTGDAESMHTVSEGLSDRFHVVRLELVGHGGSDAPPDLRFYSMPECARQIAAVVAALGLDRPHLLGYSMGGRAALAAAVAHRKCFSSLILVGATAGIADARLRDERVEMDRALADRIERDGLERFVDEWMALPIFASQKRLGDAALARARTQRLGNREHGLAQSLRGMGAGAQAPLFGALSGLELPVLLVVGDEDVKFIGIARDLETRLPNARSAILNQAGHAAHLEAPDEFASVVTRFLSEYSNRGNSDAAVQLAAPRLEDGERA